MADYVIINKENTADEDDIQTVVDNVRAANPDAEIVHANSAISVADPDDVAGNRVLVVEDGPTLTHGGTSYGAGTVAAKQYGAADTVDPRDSAVGSIRDVFDKYQHLGDVLPAMGYSDSQLQDLEETINNADCDAILVGTPHDISRLLDIDVPAIRVRYDLDERERTLADILDTHSDHLGLD